MFFTKYSYFILDKSPFLIINTSKLKKKITALVVPDFILFYLCTFLKYSIFFKKSVLYDIGAYDIPVFNISPKNSLCYTPVL